jgi:hypothetical protein
MSTKDPADSANATLALREMLSSGKLRKLVTIRSESGGLETRYVTQDGPIAYLDTTTQQAIFEEDATRMLSLATDESPEQTAAIMKLQAAHAAGTGASLAEQYRTRRKHHTAQRMLQPVKVRIPYASLLELPAHKIVARRAFRQLLTVIEAVALLRQYQKAVDEDGYIVADIIDYKIAYDLMLPVLSRTFAPLSERAVNLLDVIQTNIKTDRTFTRTDCVEWAGVGSTEVRNRLNVLVEAGLVEQLTGSQGVKCTYHILNTKNAKAPALSCLITPDALRARLEEERRRSQSQESVSRAQTGFRK